MMNEQNMQTGHVGWSPDYKAPEPKVPGEAGVATVKTHLLPGWEHTCARIKAADVSNVCKQMALALCPHTILLLNPDMLVSWDPQEDSISFEEKGAAGLARCVTVSGGRPHRACDSVQEP